MSFRIHGLTADRFTPLFGLTDDALLAQGARRFVVDRTPGYPDRIALRDCEPGETVLLVNYLHQPADTPYRASHAIFVREGETETFSDRDRIPVVMRSRLLSLRAFSAEHMMVDAEVVTGDAVEQAIERLLQRADADYIHVHFANRGCYLARIERD